MESSSRSPGEPALTGGRAPVPLLACTALAGVTGRRAAGRDGGRQVHADGGRTVYGSDVEPADVGRRKRREDELKGPPCPVTRATAADLASVAVAAVVGERQPQVSQAVWPERANRQFAPRKAVIWRHPSGDGKGGSPAGAPAGA
jgi:hypothetical protein